MASDSLGESEASHDSQTRCEPLLSVETLSLEVDLRFGAIERDALLVGLERAEIGFLGVGHGARLRVTVVPRRVIGSEQSRARERCGLHSPQTTPTCLAVRARGCLLSPAVTGDG
jgi:hypothetical protein